MSSTKSKRIRQNREEVAFKARDKSLKVCQEVKVLLHLLLSGFEY